MKKRGLLYLLSGIVIGALGFGAVPAVAAGITAALSAQPVTLNGKPVKLTAYNIEGSNYFKLRDIGAVLDIGVWYDAAENTVRIETDKPYDPDYTGPGSTVGLGRIYISDYYDANGGYSALGLALPRGVDSEGVLKAKNGDLLFVGGKQFKVTADTVTLSLYTQPTLARAIEWWVECMDSLADSGGAVVVK